MTPTNHNRGKGSSPQSGRPSVYQTIRLAESVLSGMRWLRGLCVRGRLFPEIRRRLKLGKRSYFNNPTDALKVAPTFIVNADRIEGFAIATIVVNSIYLEWEKKMDFRAQQKYVLLKHTLSWIWGTAGMYQMWRGVFCTFPRYLR